MASLSSFQNYFPEQSLVKVDDWFYDRRMFRNQQEVALEILSFNCSYRNKRQCPDCMETLKQIELRCKAKMLTTTLQDKEEFIYRWEVVEERYGTGVFLIITLPAQYDPYLHLSEILDLKITLKYFLTPKLSA